MRWRLFLAFVLVIAITLGAVGIFARQSTLREIDRFVGGGGLFGLESVVAELESYYQANGSWDGVRASLPQTPALNNNPSGNRNEGSGPPGPRPQNQSRQVGWQLTDTTGNVIMSRGVQPASETIESAVLEIAIPLKVDNQLIGYLVPQNNEILQLVDIQGALLQRYSSATLQAALIGGVIALLLALLLAYWLLRPISRLTQAAGHMAEGDLQQRVPETGPGELAALSRSFNHMAASLEGAETRRRSLTADIAHELRTPLAVQRANLEAMQDGVYSITEDNIDAVLAQNQLLTRLVEDLRTIGLADAGELHLRRTETDIVALVNQVVGRFETQAKQKGIRLNFNSVECPAIDVDPERIEQILTNLLHNALRHTPEKGIVRVKLECSQSQTKISVHDSGEGIPEESLPHLFERFYRADKARNRQDGGTGLGLSIARKLAEAHSGSLQARNHPEGGAIFILTLQS
ncbi:MAG: HAMP domain-containing protein [Chloroflexi bacterium]|nr:MAG: HAMP domain-containing protein [Chloroflexota bacterium]MBL1193409.1 HAMP domain-containing protein [Chloroflexota bacterium]NOH10701.1 HAMP domain-containing protein [Chloroflexota bacterium]